MNRRERRRAARKPHRDPSENCSAPKNETPSQPTSDYLERVKGLDVTVSECMTLSHDNANIPSPTARHFYASVLFTTLIGRALSLAVLVPHTRLAAKKIEAWDYASAAIIVRTMLEIRIAFYYLCIEDCSDDEWSCRWNIFNLNDCISRQRLFGAMESADKTAEFVTAAEELRNRLRLNPYFLTLPNGQQRKLLNGQTPYLEPLEVLSEKAGLDKSSFRWLYVFLSSHVHALPMSFYRIGPQFADRGRGVYSTVEEGYTALCISLAISFLVKTRDEFKVMFSGLKAV